MATPWSMFDCFVQGNVRGKGMSRGRDFGDPTNSGLDEGILAFQECADLEQEAVARHMGKDGRVVPAQRGREGIGTEAFNLHCHGEGRHVLARQRAGARPGDALDHLGRDAGQRVQRGGQRPR